ncbi:MAG TPA: histidine kinase [Chitinophagaceae bacterium]|nr:histidine kinase [Chitinophagaceae bacterium]
MLSKLSPSLRLALYYFLFSAAWILLSGRVAAWMARGRADNLRMIEDFKGLFFVMISSIFIFTISRGVYRKLMSSLRFNKEMLEKYQGVMNATQEGIYEYDLKTTNIKLSENIRKLLGEKDSIKKDGLNYWKEHIHPDDRDRILAEIKTVYSTDAQSWQGEYRFFTARKEYKEISHRIFVLRDKDQPYTIIGAVQDITAQRQLQREYLAQQLQIKNEITRNIIRAEERERDRWAQELHDNIAQMLGVVRLYVSMIRSQPEKREEMIQKTTDLVEQSITEIRQLSANLKPPVFEEEEEGLKSAIESLLANIGRVKPLHFSLDIDDEQSNRYLNNDQKLMIYRIIQEQLNNIVKYANASKVSIRIDIHPPTAVVMITDDGIGFEPDKLVTGIGLKNIRSRLNMFNGQLEIDSAPGKGCELRSAFQLN